MPSIDDLLDQLPLDQIAAQLGVDRATAESATRAALPALVEGMQANAQDQERAASLVRAIAGHAQSAAPDSLADVDTDDGAKIVNHVFGDNTDAVVNQLGGLGGGSELVKKLLPLLAPLLMGFLAKQFGGAAKESAGTLDSADDTTGDDSSGGGIGDLLKGSLGGLFGDESGSDGGGSSGGLGDLLGGLLGGGSGSSGGGLGDLLGGLLGRGSR
jgi:hypothetical protein